LTTFSTSERIHRYFKLRLHHHDHITDSGQVDNDPPNSDYEFLFIDAQKIVTGQNGGYRSITLPIWTKLDHDYYSTTSTAARSTST